MDPPLGATCLAMQVGDEGKRVKRRSVLGFVALSKYYFS